MLAEVISRLEARAPDLAGRVRGAADFAELMRSGNLPQVTPAAHVIPLGLQGRAADAAAGIFRQDYTESVGVILTLRAGDATADRLLPELDALIMQVVTALCGWAPGPETGVFSLIRASLVSMSRGALVYQIDLAIEDQLRITP